MTQSVTKLKARAEVVLKKHGMNFNFIESHVGSKKYITKEDKDSNIIFIGPTGKLVVISVAGKIFTSNSYYCVSFLDGTKYSDYNIKLFEKVDSSNIEVDFSNPNLREHEIEKKYLFGLSKITINDTGEYPNIDWSEHLGKEIIIEILGKKTEQVVLSLGIISEDDPRLATIIKKLIRESKKIPNVEIGQWVVFGKKKIYESGIFTSKRFKEIHARDAFQKLAETIQKALKQENESDLNRLSLLHTHPISGGPLSYQDILTLQTIAKQLGAEGDDHLEIFAIPTPDNGSIIFKYTLK
jgi:hypothetical protein